MYSRGQVIDSSYLRGGLLVAVVIIPRLNVAPIQRISQLTICAFAYVEPREVLKNVWVSYYDCPIAFVPFPLSSSSLLSSSLPRTGAAG